MTLHRSIASVRPSFSRKAAGFTLVEIMFYVAISLLVFAALFTTLFAGLRIYYAESDYLSIGGQTRRLVDDMVEQGTFADDLVVFRDISDIVPATAGDRGDCLMFFNRDSDGTGNIRKFVCYYLAQGVNGVTVWKINGAPGTLTSDPATALTNYTRTGLKEVSSVVFVGSLPRPTPVVTNPITVRVGVFTNDGSRVGKAPTVLVNLPAKLIARVGSPNETSNVTVAISPRH